MTTDDANWVRHRYAYDPETGAFTWRNPPNKGPRNRMHVGQPAGTINHADGMLMLRLGKKMHSAARVAWLYAYGDWPDRQVHYKDASIPLPTRNKLDNLRLVGEAAPLGLTADTVRQLFDYDQATGIFRWRVRRRNVKPGDIAGSTKRTGAHSHRYIRIENVDYAAQRVAWFYVHGEWPKTRLEFKDGDRTNCAIANLVEGEFEHRTRQTPFVSAEEIARRRSRTYRRSDLKRSFGLSEAEYQAIHDAQDGCCAICHQPERTTRNGKPRHLSVDHDHRTDAIRELLCNNCNALLGLVDDDVDLLGAAIDYLRKHGALPLPRKESA